MRKTILIIILIGISLSINAQNTFPSSGNVGIGTINPSQKLDVLGNIYLNSVSASSTSNKINSSSILFKSSGYATDNKTRYQLWQVLSIGKSIWGSGDLVFNSNTDGMGYNERIRFSANGNVGIGTANPGTWKLAVNGEIRAKEIKVETGWSDFVFYDDYKLPTLLEVENHIKEKGHLKDIPSAEEVNKNGIFLGEMDSKLLQKIEELTLYTIEQEKRLNSIELKNEKLKKENESLKFLATKFLELQKRLDKIEDINRDEN